MDDNQPRKISVESNTQIMADQRVVMYIPQKMNGVSILEPVPCIQTFDQLLALAAQVIMLDIDARNKIEQSLQSEMPTNGSLSGLVIPRLMK